MSNWEIFLIFAVLVEGVVTVLTQVYVREEGKLWWQSIKWNMIIAIVVSVGIAFAAKMNIFAGMGVPLTPEWLDYVLSGFLSSRGAAYVYELMKLIKETRYKAAAETVTEQLYLPRSESPNETENPLPGP